MLALTIWAQQTFREIIVNGAEIAHSKISWNLLSWKVLIHNVQKSELPQTPVLSEPQQPPTASRNNNNNNDGLEVLETREWLDSLDYFLATGGPERAGRLLQQLQLHARR